MPRSLEEQNRTHERLLAEISKAPNAMKILKLFNQIMDDELEFEKATFSFERKLVAQKDKVIAELRKELHGPRNPSFRQIYSRWN